MRWTPKGLRQSTPCARYMMMMLLLLLLLLQSHAHAHLPCGQEGTKMAWQCMRASKQAGGWRRGAAGEHRKGTYICRERVSSYTFGSSPIFCLKTSKHVYPAKCDAENTEGERVRPCGMELTHPSCFMPWACQKGGRNGQ